MWIFIALRFLFVLIPQPGYVHPDEFFQGPEVAAGDLLGYDIHRTWEFTKKPIRSVASTHTPSLIYILLHSLSDHLEITPYLLLISPRLIMTLFSLVNDVCLYQLSKRVGKNPKTTMLTFTTSYIPLCLYTKTFSNNMEASIFSMLLYLTIATRSTGPYSTNKYRNWRLQVIGVLFGMGIFIRPTFILFAFAPVLMILYLSRQRKHDLFCMGIPCGFIGGLICLMDSFYYSELKLDNLFNSLTLTPLNFIIYNSNNTNTALHGRHFTLQHFLVNMPCLFGLVGVFALYDLMSSIWRASLSNKTTIQKLLFASWVLPTMCLTLVPHQEMRFLIPLFVPVVVLYGEWVWESRLRTVFWIAFNLLGLFLMGHLHQAGLLPAIMDVAQDIKLSTDHKEILFYRTYMPPRFLLQLPSNQNEVVVSDLAGSDVDYFINHIQNLTSTPTNKGGNIFIIIPGTVSQHLDKTVFKNSSGGIIKQNNFKDYFPHLTMEDPPNINSLYQCYMSACNCWTEFKLQFSLRVYRLSL